MIMNMDIMEAGFDVINGRPALVITGGGIHVNLFCNSYFEKMIEYLDSDCVEFTAIAGNTSIEMQKIADNNVRINIISDNIMTEITSSITIMLAACYTV